MDHHLGVVPDDYSTITTTDTIKADIDGTPKYEFDIAVIYLVYEFRTKHEHCDAWTTSTDLMYRETLASNNIDQSSTSDSSLSTLVETETLISVTVLKRTDSDISELSFEGEPIASELPEWSLQYYNCPEEKRFHPGAPWNQDESKIASEWRHSE